MDMDTPVEMAWLIMRHPGAVYQQPWQLSKRGVQRHTASRNIVNDDPGHSGESGPTSIGRRDVAWRAVQRRPVRRPPLVYWPLAGPFLFAAVVIAALIAGFLLVGVFSYALARLGIAPGAAALVLLASVLGAAVNIPIARLRDRAVRLEPQITVFGIRYLVPVLRSRTTVLAVNLGGALIPAALSVYLIGHDHLGWLALAAVAIVAVLVYVVSRPVPGLGIAVPALLPGLFAVLTAVVLHPTAVAGLAYVGGTLGTLLGADLANLPKVRKLGAPVASIGGAGTFDGIFLAGIVAVVLAGLL
jgi:uncharacterized membrane protein